jgi:hypothetical protein
MRRCFALLTAALASAGSASAFSIQPTTPSANLVQMSMRATSTEDAMGNGSSIGAVGSKLTDMDLAMEALGKFFESAEEIQLTPTTGGVNNIVQYVTLPSGEKELL